VLVGEALVELVLSGSAVGLVLGVGAVVAHGGGL
jgi:hypothetical protein